MDQKQKKLFIIIFQKLCFLIALSLQLNDLTWFTNFFKHGDVATGALIQGRKIIKFVGLISLFLNKYLPLTFWSLSIVSFCQHENLYHTFFIHFWFHVKLDIFSLALIRNRLFLFLISALESPGRKCYLGKHFIYLVINFI